MNISPEPWSAAYEPWTSQAGEPIPAFSIYDADQNKIAETNENSPSEQQEWNARLIEAAPNMLRALHAAQNALNTAVNFRVGDRSSYDIAAEVSRVITSITHGPTLPTAS